jgi:hypothetical protein
VTIITTELTRLQASLQLMQWFMIIIANNLIIRANIAEIKLKGRVTIVATELVCS